MWFRKKAPAAGATAVAEKPPVPPEGERAQPSKLGTSLKGYSELAAKLGFCNGALLTAQIQDFCVEQEIPLWRVSAVETFLTEKAKREPKVRDWNGEHPPVWCWKPLRECDVGKLTNHLGVDRNGHLSNQRYHGAVPIQALQRVEAFAKQFGEKVHFYVSDYASPNPDPFLMVTAVGVGDFIIAHWDEPGFTG